ncbi:unnamed protein product [Allacma fusca]|uniref:EGF-like domain-containing protein n=1 Tax=Allacma fusca TaxID=39272 RepID=A0A8J2KH66_9HEXA|nr:unnamed protein product [Allacma fusca]
MSLKENKLRLTTLLLSCCVFVLALPKAQSIHLSHHGENCDDTLPCDSRQRLTCQEGKCICIPRPDVIFEESSGKCVTKAGDQCRFVLEDSAGGKTFDITACVENAKCSQNGFCSCGENFFENHNGTCSPPATHLQPCDDKIHCQESAGLVCEMNTCGCNSTTAIFSSDANQCVGLAEQNCINSKCTANAFCNRIGLCSCSHDHFPKSNGICSPMVALGEGCSEDELCHSDKGLTCAQGICSCDPLISVYGTAQANNVGRYPENFNEYIGPNLTQCLGKVNSPCIERLCVPNAYCSYNSRYSLSGTCRCQPGTVSDSKSIVCKQGYGYDCSPTLYCLQEFVCNQSKCACRYGDQVYDSVKRFCLSKVGGPCSDDMPCVSGAECIRFPKSSHGVCSCESGHITSPARFCELQYGQKCNGSTNRCDSLAKLDCIDEVCGCRKFGIYSSEHRRCLGFVGTPCTQATSDEGPQCIENAICSSEYPGLQTVCNCNDGFTLTSNYTCEPSTDNIQIPNALFKENEITSPEEVVI